MYKVTILSDSWLDRLCDNLKRDGWSYGFMRYIDEDGVLWLQIDASKGDELRIYKEKVGI